MHFPENSPQGILWRQRRFAAAVWLLAGAAGIAAIYCMAATYRAEAKLFVRLGRENVTLDSTVNFGQGAMSAVPLTREGEMNSIVELLRTRKLFERLADQLGVETILDSQASWADYLPLKKPATRERAIAKLDKMIEVAALRKSNLVKVAFDADSPELARRGAEIYVDAFLEEYRRLTRNPGVREFFAQQADDSKKEVHRVEAEILSLKNKVGTVAIEEQKRLLLSHRSTLLQELETTQAEIASTDAAIANLKAKRNQRPDRLVTEKTTGLPNVAADNIRDQLYTLQLKEKELSSMYRDKHPLLQQVRRQLAEAKALHDAEDHSRTQVVEARSRLLDEIEIALDKQEAERESLAARLAARNPQLRDVETRLAALNETEDRLAKLQRDLDFHRDSYQSYSKSLEQARIDELLQANQISNIAIAQPAIASDRPIGPNRPLLAGLVILASGLLAACLAMLKDRFRFSEPAPRQVSYA